MTLDNEVYVKAKLPERETASYIREVLLEQLGAVPVIPYETKTYREIINGGLHKTTLISSEKHITPRVIHREV